MFKAHFDEEAPALSTEFHFHMKGMQFSRAVIMQQSPTFKHRWKLVTTAD